MNEHEYFAKMRQKAYLVVKGLRGMGQHSWKCSRFKRTQMKIIHKYNLVQTLTLFAFHTNKKQY